MFVNGAKRVRIFEEVSSEVRIVAVVVVERSSVFVITFGKRSSSLSDVCFVAVRTGKFVDTGGSEFVGGWGFMSE